MIENPASGEQIAYTRDDADSLEWDAVWPRPGRRTARHVHPHAAETWTVVEGEAAVEVDGVVHRLAAGQSVSAPAGLPHVAWNPTDGPVRVHVSMRPPGRWRRFTERLFAGEDVMALVAEFADEVRPA